MKSILKITLIITIIFSWPSFVLADSDDNHKSEIEKGRELVENKVSCDELSDEQLETMGEYLMEQMHAGESHEVMDQMMGGESSDSLKQMHIQMTKRIYCNENSGAGNMMNMMGWGWFGWVFMILFWVLIIIGIVALIKWLANQSKPTKQGKTALEILKEYYAKGEIDKKEFEEKKQDLA